MNTDDNPPAAADLTSEIGSLLFDAGSTASPQTWTAHDGLRHYLRQDYPELEPGDPVTYHGSITGSHGPAFRLGPCACDRCYRLPTRHRRELLAVQHHGDIRLLHHVRTASITPHPAATTRETP